MLQSAKFGLSELSCGKLLHLVQLSFLLLKKNTLSSKFVFIIKLGATPYVDIRASKELVQRVQRGLRLKQPSNVGLSLFQIIVSCWQIDLDERPAFSELVAVLQQSFNQALDCLSFNLFPDFIYERYDPTVEVNR